MPFLRPLQIPTNACLKVIAVQQKLWLTSRMISGLSIWHTYGTCCRALNNHANCWLQRPWIATVWELSNLKTLALISLPRAPAVETCLLRLHKRSSGCTNGAPQAIIHGCRVVITATQDNANGEYGISISHMVSGDDGAGNNNSSTSSTDIRVFATIHRSLHAHSCDQHTMALAVAKSRG